MKKCLFWECNRSTAEHKSWAKNLICLSVLDISLFIWYLPGLNMSVVLSKTSFVIFFPPVYYNKLFLSLLRAPTMITYLVHGGSPLHSAGSNHLSHTKLEWKPSHLHSINDPRASHCLTMDGCCCLKKINRDHVEALNSDPWCNSGPQTHSAHTLEQIKSWPGAFRRIRTLYSHQRHQVL